jgi:hypothetical protein
VAKLAPPLPGLADRVAKEGKDGTLEIGKLKVTGWKVEVLIKLNGITTKEMRDALAKLGFEETGVVSNPQVVLGTIDVRKLEEFAKLEIVTRVSTMALR